MDFIDCLLKFGKEIIQPLIQSVAHALLSAGGAVVKKVMTKRPDKPKAAGNAGDASAPSPAYTVAFDANGGNGTAPDAKSVTAGESITLPDGGGLSKTGYTLSGWSAQANGGTLCAVKTRYTPTANTTLYAQWAVRFEPDMPSDWRYLQTALVSNDKGFMNFDASWFGPREGNCALLWDKGNEKHFSWRFERVSAGLFKVVNGSDFVLDISGNGSKVQASKDNGTDAQRFRFQKIGDNLYKIFTVNDNITLHVESGHISNGTHIVTGATDTSDNNLSEKWRLAPPPSDAEVR